MDGWGRRTVGIALAALSLAGAGGTATSALGSKAAPTITLRRVSGKIFLRPPDSTAFTSLSSSRRVEIGTEVEATNGRVALRASSGQHGEFFQGRFVIQASAGVIELVLSGSSFKDCRGARKLAAADKQGPPRKLWGDGKGKFKTRGRYSVTSVRGTKWFMSDSCAGTLTRVARGSIAVTDLLPNRQVALRQGRRYVAKAPIEFAVPTDSSDPGSIAAGPDGNLWFTEGVGNVGRSTPNGSIIEFTVPASDTNDTGESSPEKIVEGPDRNLWVTDPSSHTVDRITSAGKVTLFDVSGAPHGLTVGPDNNLWFTEDNSTIGRITPSGVVTETSIPVGLDEAADITSGADGRLWFVEPSANKIARMSLAGELTEFDVPTEDATPSGIVRGPDGNVWFTEATAGKVAKITPTGFVTEFTLPEGEESAPQEITVGPDKNLWVTDPVKSRIARVGVNGLILEVPTPTDAAGPMGITGGPKGTIWFTENDANGIGCVRC
jgi:streptogramin lyase